MARQFVRLIFEHGLTEKNAWEASMRGYLSHVWVELDDGSRHPIFFFDPTRLAQELASEAASGRPFVAERGLIVVAEVTLENMEHAARTLAAEGFFDAPAPDVQR